MYASAVTAKSVLTFSTTVLCHCHPDLNHNSCTAYADGSYNQYPYRKNYPYG
jgi:hypothetical protein